MPVKIAVEIPVGAPAGRSASSTATAFVALATLVACTLIGGCAGRADEQVVLGGIGASVDAYMTAITPYGFSGALLVASGGEVVLAKGYGLADDEAGVPNTPATVFTTGSITKQFTAAAVMRLEMDGLLSINDPLSAHLDGVPEDKAGITLHHLLTHTAGVVGSTGADFEEVGRDEVVKRVMTAPLEFEPGSDMYYSNGGYSVLAAVVERVSGRTYEEYLRDALFEPAGMKNTGYRLPRWDERMVARWYDGDDDNGTLLEKAYPYWNLIGNGGIQSTLGDMFLWYEALRDEAVLSEDAKAGLWTPFLNDYACGWDVLETPHGRLVQHDGGSTLGASAEFRWFVDEDILIVLFCNRSYQGAPLFEMVRSEIEELSFGGDVAAPPPAVEIGDELLDAYAGNYRLASGGGILVKRTRDGLLLKTFDQDVVNALFQPDADPRTHDDLNTKSGRLLAAAASSNSDGFVAELGDGDFARRVQGLLTQHMARFAAESGSPPRLSVSLGSVPLGDDGTVMTGMRIRNAAGGRDDLSFWWKDGQLVGIDTRAYEMSVPLAPFSETQFIGYHLGFARVHSVVFEVDEGGRVALMRIGPHAAYRVGGAGHGEKGHVHDGSCGVAVEEHVHDESCGHDGDAGGSGDGGVDED
ncbi:MAG: serine hydrolase domain-containing protein [Candidatus Eisenbacteria bacterium]